MNSIHNKTMEVIKGVSSPMYIPLLSHWKDGNVSNRYVNKLTRQLVGQYGIELLGEDTKLFFDLDGKGKELMNLTYEFKAHLDKLLESGERKFIYCYSKPEDMEAASKRRDYRKLSFHIIFEDKAIHRIGFSPKKEEDTLKFLLGDFYETLRPCVDKAVYDKNRKFRLPHYYNDEKPIELVPCDPTIDLTRFAVNLPPGFYKIEMPAIVEKVYDEKKEDEPISDERRKSMTDMLKMVKLDRFAHYPDWHKLLCLMKSNGLSLTEFQRMSKESGYSSYNPDSCADSWYTNKDPQRPGFPTIHKWLEEDGVDWKTIFCPKTQTIVTKMLAKIKQTGTLTHYEAAVLFYEEKKDDIYNTPMGWLVYDEEKGWQRGDERLLILPFMRACGCSLSSYVSSMKIDESLSSQEKIAEDKRRLLLRKIANQLQDYSYVSKVTKVMSELFRNDEIVKQFDNHPELFCFSDLRAWDLENSRVVEIKKHHKILTHCGRPFPERIEQEVNDTRNFILSYQDLVTLDSFLSMCACSFFGKNKNQVIFIHTGVGGNGKSVHADLMCLTLGNYAGLLPIEQYTVEAKSRSEANSALAAMVGKRYARSNEPEDDPGQKLKISRIKQITGDTDVDVRQLYGQTFPMSIKFTPHILANDIPSLSKQDGGIARRIKVIRYPYVFKEFPDPTDPTEKKKILDIDLSKYINGFFYLCADAWTKTKGVYKETEEVKEDVEEYLRENNPLIAFLSDFENSEAPYEFFRAKDLHELFNAWCDRASPRIEHYKSKAFGALLDTAVLSNGERVRVEKDPKKGHKIFVRAKTAENQKLSKPKHVDEQKSQ